jgi:hypothetical protein
MSSYHGSGALAITLHLNSAVRRPNLRSEARVSQKRIQTKLQLVEQIV